MINNKKISIITIPYSQKQFNDIVNNITLQSYKYIEIIAVDYVNCLNISKDFYYHDGTFVNIFKPTNIEGYYKGLRFGLMQASGEYIVFNTKDCFFDDKNFFYYSIQTFSKDRDADIVFGNNEIISSFKFNVKKYNFKQFYSPKEFIEEWEKLRMIFVDYFDLNSFIFKKSILLEAKAFLSQYENALSLDASTLLKSVILSKKIVYLNLNATKKFILNIPTTDEKINTKDLTEQIMNHFAICFDLKQFINDKNIKIEQLSTFLNKYADYAINSVYFNYFSNFNNEIFNNISEKHNLKEKKIFVYGKGWVGLEFESFLNSQNIVIEKFIDDYKTGKDIISFNEFKKNRYDNCLVIIAIYKYKDVLNIYKKLSMLDNIEIIDLFCKDIV